MRNIIMGFMLSGAVCGFSQPADPAGSATNSVSTNGILLRMSYGGHLFRLEAQALSPTNHGQRLYSVKGGFPGFVHMISSDGKPVTLRTPQANDPMTYRDCFPEDGLPTSRFSTFSGRSRISLVTNEFSQPGTFPLSKFFVLRKAGWYDLRVKPKLYLTQPLREEVTPSTLCRWPLIDFPELSLLIYISEEDILGVGP